ncbi:MAG TPA: helix-turn-helix domain-containing protein [Solirubrobacteraceae bacterium]|nr:helix-turn-helix domain-containing protein [Solirubrobacteraceae bacterium]
MEALTRGEVLRQIIERADLDLFADRVLESFWEQPAFQQLHPPREDVRAWVRWNLDLVIRWLVQGEPPSESELAVFREHAQARAREGFGPDVIPANFRRGARFAWRAMLEAATEEEQPALLESADLLFEYVDRVSRIYSEGHASAARVTATSAEEIAAGALLRRIEAEESPLPEDHRLAQRLGFALERAARPFVIALPDRSPERHAELAAKLRQTGALAASEGRRVVGLSGGAAPWRRLNLDPQAVIAHGPPAISAERGHSLDELRDVAHLALARGGCGEVGADDYLPELLLRRSPRIASELQARIYSPLDGDHAELARTLDVLIKNNFEKGATAAALPVHRNTLRDRIVRISELTGVDLEGTEGRGLAWLAWLARGKA